jgi:hypothetical protein
MLNFLPFLPLDGGHAMVALVDLATKGRGEQPVRWASIGAAAALGLAAAHGKMLLPMLLCAMWAIQNVRALKTQVTRNEEAILRVHVQAAFDAAGHGDCAQAIRHCRTVLAATTEQALRADALRLLAYAYATNDDWRHLTELLESGAAAALAEGELQKYQRAARELGHPDEARRIGALA